jgi:hypothetical protein
MFFACFFRPQGVQPDVGIRIPEFARLQQFDGFDGRDDHRPLGIQDLLGLINPCFKSDTVVDKDIGTA